MEGFSLQLYWTEEHIDLEHCQVEFALFVYVMIKYSKVLLINNNNL